MLDWKIKNVWVLDTSKETLLKAKLLILPLFLPVKCESLVQVKLVQYTVTNCPVFLIFSIMEGLEWVRGI